MKRITLSVLCCILSLLSVGQEYRPVHGTLISMMLSRDGLVIVADKRGNDPVRGHTDTLNKIFITSKYTGFVTTGYPILIRTSDYREVFNADKIIRTELGSASSIDTPLIRRIGASLSNAFLTCLDSIPFDQWPATPNDLDANFFQVVICEYVTQTGLYRLHTGRFRYRKFYPQPRLAFNYVLDIVPADRIKHFIAGSTTVYREVLIGSNPLFDNVRANRQIKRFFFEAPMVNDVSYNEVADFLTHFNKIAHERTVLLDSTDAHIGPTVNIALLSADGFRFKQ